MGFDIVLFDRSDVTIGLVEMPERLHRAVFSEQVYWRSYPYLRKISDYYTTDVRLKRDELQQLINELRQIKPLIA